MVNITINGFGRIGRLLYRSVVDRAIPVNVVAVHDLFDLPLARHLLVHDSHYGTWSHSPRILDGYLHVGDHTTKFLQNIPTESLPWRDMGVDLVVEATGRMCKRAALMSHVTCGARRVLVTSGCSDADRTIIFGVNENGIHRTDRILSCASCTSNCLIPILWALQDHYGLRWGNFLSVHSQTNDQRVVDSGHHDWCRARSASQSIIPTSTHATAVLQQIMPDVPVQGSCVRVPVNNVSMLYLSCQLKRQTSLQSVIDYFKHLSRDRLRGILRCSHEPLVSIDHKQSSASAIISIPSVHHEPQFNNLSLSAWYDNEWGYVQRLVDVISYLQNRQFMV